MLLIGHGGIFVSVCQICTDQPTAAIAICRDQPTAAITIGILTAAIAAAKESTARQHVCSARAGRMARKDDKGIHSTAVKQFLVRLTHTLFSRAGAEYCTRGQTRRSGSDILDYSRRIGPAGSCTDTCCKQSSQTKQHGYLRGHITQRHATTRTGHARRTPRPLKAGISQNMAYEHKASTQQALAMRLPNMRTHCFVSSAVSGVCCSGTGASTVRHCAHVLRNAHASRSMPPVTRNAHGRV